MSFDCKCSAALPHGTVGWYSLSYLGISWSYPFTIGYNMDTMRQAACLVVSTITDHLCYFCLVFVMLVCAYVYRCLVVTCWERADLLALVCDV